MILLALKAGRLILLLWLALLGVAQISAAILHAPENRTWRFFNVGYDKVAHLNAGYDGSEKLSSAYDVAPSRAKPTTKDEQRHNAPPLLRSVDYFPLTPDGTTTAQNAALVWDAENRLVSSTPSGGSATTYLYDALGRRIAKKHGTDAQRIYLYDGFNLIAEYSDTTLAKTFTWGLDISGSLQGAGGVGGLLATQLHTGDNAGVYYPTYDGNGNVSEYLKSNGDVAAHYEYGPFGEPLVSTGAVAAEMPFRFSTHYTDDEAGLVYAKRRYYSPITGRWLSRDPIGEEGGINLYGYVGNSPTNRIDPLGLWPNSLTGNPTNAAIAAQAMADLGGSAAATGAVLTAAQIAVKELEHTNYSRRCSEKPPSGLCCCELARWILGQREDCLSMRQDFANKWYSGGYDPGHAEFMKNQARAIEKARAAVERLCR
jgi:RHS repeat-associated protein